MGCPDDPRPRIQQRCADGPAETAARARHQCGCAGQRARHGTAACPLRSPSAAAFGLLTWGAIIPEERYLSAKFGAQYLASTHRVHHWL
jgi:hypothetical protein